MNTSMIFASLWLAVAWQSSTSVEQISPSPAPVSDEPATQLSKDISVRAGSQSAQPAQLGDKESAKRETVQLTTEQPGGEVSQLGRRDRNMQSSPDLAKRSEGFETRVIKLEGSDKCGAELLSAKDRDYCQRVIENRAAEYAGPQEAKLTPEQILLTQRNLRQIDGGTDGAIKRLATGRNSADDSADQAVASVVLASSDVPTQTSQSEPAENQLSAETEALLNAIVRNLGGPGG